MVGGVWVGLVCSVHSVGKFSIVRAAVEYIALRNGGLDWYQIDDSFLSVYVLQ